MLGPRDRPQLDAYLVASRQSSVASGKVTGHSVSGVTVVRRIPIGDSG